MKVKKNKTWQQQYEIIKKEIFKVLSSSGQKYTRAGAAELLDTTIARVRAWESGQRPSSDDLQKIGEKLELSAQWLLFNRGTPKVINLSQPEEINTLTDLTDLRDAETSGYLVLFSDGHSQARTVCRKMPTGVVVSDKRLSMSIPEYLDVRKATPRLDDAGNFVMDVGGHGHLALRKDWLERLSRTPAYVVSMEVKGHAMDPDIRHRDTVLIDTGATDIIVGEAYCLGMGREVMLAYLTRTPGKLRVNFANPEYDYFEVGADSDAVRVLGKVIWTGRTL